MTRIKSKQIWQYCIKIRSIYRTHKSLNSFVICSALIGFTENKQEETWKGYLYAALFFVNGIASSIFFHQLFHIGMTLGMRVKSAVIAAVYKKVHTNVSSCFLQLNIKRIKTQGWYQRVSVAPKPLAHRSQIRDCPMVATKN